MKRVMWAAVLAATVTGACGSPTAPVVDTHIKINDPVFTGTPPTVPAFTPYPPSDWNPAPGQRENPLTPPNECDCAPGYVAFWNGNNWLCARQTDREFPHKNAYCRIER